MEILSNFAETLEELIFENKMDIKQFADKIEISLSEAYFYLSGTYTPRLSTVIKIADCFNCSVDYLLGIAPYQDGIIFKTTPPFSKRFKELLETKKLSRYRLRKETGIAECVIDSWYKGKVTPSTDNAIKLAKYFDCSVDSLLGRE